MSSICSGLVYVYYLSRFCPMDSGQAMGRCIWQKSTLCPKYVHVQSLSSLSPISNFGISKAQMWTLKTFPRSKVCPDTVQCKNRHNYKLMWTEFGQAVDFYVQSLSIGSWNWHRFDRALTRLGHQWDKPSTRPFFGQTFDIPLTLFGQRLDFLSSPCPTTHWWVVPTYLCHLEGF